MTDLRALIVDWGGVLTTPLQDSMLAWCDADGIDYVHFHVRRAAIDDAAACRKLAAAFAAGL